MIHFKNNAFVRLRFTGQLAQVLGQIDEEYLEVRLVEDGTIITVAAENTVPSADATAKQEQPKEVFDAHEQGCSAMLLPGLDGGIEYCYHLYFSNGTKFKWLAEAGLWDSGRKLARHYFTVDPGKMIRVFQFSRDQINLRPLLDFKIRRITTRGTDGELSAEIRLKAKNLFKKRRELFDGRYCYQFELDDLLQRSRAEVEKIDIVHRENDDSSDNYFYQRFQYQLMSHEKDLHIESLVDDPMAFEHSEILAIQLKEMTKYVERAALNNLDHVFLIHGIGKGVLKKHIHRDLSKMPFVKEYKNEYHPRYGWGATEVFFS